MIDTIRISGTAETYRFQYDYVKFRGSRTKDGSEYINEVLVENKKGKYRAFYVPGTDRIDIELNVGKLIFQNNIYNYENEPSRLLSLVCACGAAFFSNNDFFVSRVDLGHVQGYSTRLEANNVVDSFRYAKPSGARLGKWRVQNYEHSVFYPSDARSIKIYHKGAEMSTQYNAEELEAFFLRDGIDLGSLLRYEVTYRSKYLAQLGMKKTPFWGVHITQLDMSVLLADYWETFKKWERYTNPVRVNEDLRGVMLLCAMADREGKLDEYRVSGMVSRSAYHRYRKLQSKRKPDNERVINTEIKYLNNMPQKVSQLYNYARTFGFSSLI